MARFASNDGMSFAPRLGGHRILPVTGFIIAANLVTFVVEFFSQRALFSFLDFSTLAVASRPWSLFSYPLHASQDILWLLLGGYLLWWIGTTLEGQWGSLEYGLFFASVTLLAALSYAVASLAVSAPLGLAGYGIPLGAVFLAWCMLNPHATVLFMMVIPIQARWLGYASLVLLYFGTRHPVLGFFAILAPLGAWYYAARGRWFRHLAASIENRSRVARIEDYRPETSRRPAGWNPLTWWKRYQRRKEVEEIVRRMGLEDGPPPRPRRDDDLVN